MRLQLAQKACVTEEMTPISPAAVLVAPALGDFAGVVGARPARAGSASEMRRTTSAEGHHVVHAPAVGAADVHELDEAQDVARFRASARAASHDAGGR